MSDLPLAGVKVLDLSRLLPGPYASLVLADLGADVVKVEDPRGGDWLRWMPPLVGSESGYFHALNRNKRSVALDLRDPAGAQVLRRLARWADVVLESFRPGVMDRLGLGWEALRRENPRLVLCSISGYGQDGPYRERAGHDLNYAATSGVLALNGPEERPVPLGIQAADVAGGSWPAVTGILAALVRRQATGAGSRVDVSMTEGALALLAMQLGGAFARGAPLRRGQELLVGGSACYRVYATSDGAFVAFAALEPEFFSGFCEAVGRPDLSDRQMEDDGRGPVAELEAIFASRTRDEWTRFAERHDVCLSPVLAGREPEQDPQLAARAAFFDVETPWEGRPVRGVASPVRFEGVTLPRRCAPRLGEHTREVLREAGFTDGEIDAVATAG
ncbi:MAG TPA: CaiB/BaiF CoA-transferase family protein [Anaeromyxobacteraceae bacterium]|nr:CaiB/BaiF CoA-transferase family protein [Anaeromyxobacteraceae bacterium]